MLFKPELAQLILEGKKTQTRRIIKAGESAFSRGFNAPRFPHWFIEHPEDSIAWVYSRTGKHKHAVGFKTYAIQPGRGKNAIGRIRITEIRVERLQDIKPKEIYAEGIYPFHVRPKLAFIDLWNSINKPPHDWDSNPLVWVYEFELLEG